MLPSRASRTHREREFQGCLDKLRHSVQPLKGVCVPTNENQVPVPSAAAWLLLLHTWRDTPHVLLGCSTLELRPSVWFSQPCPCLICLALCYRDPCAHLLFLAIDLSYKDRLSCRLPVAAASGYEEEVGPRFLLVPSLQTHLLENQGLP